MKKPPAKSGRARTDAPLDGAKPPTTPTRSKAKRQPRARVMMPMEPASADVAQLAHQLFLSRGRVHGHDLDDWLEAERQLRATRANSTDRARAALAAEAGRDSR